VLYPNETQRSLPPSEETPGVSLYANQADLLLETVASLVDLTLHGEAEEASLVREAQLKMLWKTRCYPCIRSERSKEGAKADTTWF